MDLDDTERALRDSLAAWLADHVDRQHAGRADRPVQAAPWAELARDLGLLGAGLPERIGGLGGGLRLQAVALCTLGEALAAEAYLAGAVVGGAALLAAGDDARLAQVVDGSLRPAFAHLEPGARGGADEVGLALRQGAGGARLHGRKSAVAGAAHATHLIVSARGDAGLAVVLVDAAASGLTRRDLRTLDGGGAAELGFDGVPVAAVLGGEALLQDLLDRWTIAHGAEALGVLQRLMADTTEHLRMRRQFGRALAEFQVLQHRLADMHVALVQAEALVEAVVTGFDAASPGERRAAVASAALAVGRACRTVAEGAVQLHGAMGVTEEAAVGRWARRALQIELQAARAAFHLPRLDAALHPPP